jgi:hypothetical protein
MEEANRFFRTTFILYTQSKMTETTTITRNSIAEAVYNRTFILDLLEEEKE